ncbi:MAG TPA: MTH1187 family thiamine-binding protein [Halothiobacillus sp.]|nr:MTH1187 family thiamine-binding protein [Halothiobacillus sp.]
MKATAELQVIPIGNGVSVRDEVTRVVELLNAHDFLVETHASGTNIEGDLNEILAAVAEVHEVLHRAGSVRLVSYLKLETRTDKEPTLAGKALHNDG